MARPVDRHRPSPARRQGWARSPPATAWPPTSRGPPAGGGAHHAARPASPWPWHCSWPPSCSSSVRTGQRRIGRGGPSPGAGRVPARRRRGSSSPSTCCSSLPLVARRGARRRRRDRAARTAPRPLRPGRRAGPGSRGRVAVAGRSWLLVGGLVARRRSSSPAVAHRAPRPAVGAVTTPRTVSCDAGSPGVHLPTRHRAPADRPWPAAPRRPRRRPDRRPDGGGLPRRPSCPPTAPWPPRSRTPGRAAPSSATLPEWYDDPEGKDPRPRHRHAGPAGRRLRAQRHASRARRACCSPGSPRSPPRPWSSLDAGPGRYLQLAFVDTADGAPAVSYTPGQPPHAGAPGRAGRVEPWPVQVAVSEAAADALGLQVGDRAAGPRRARPRPLVVRDQRHLRARRRGRRGLAGRRPELLEPTSSTSEDEPRTAAAALVSDESLADLRFALPGDALRRRVVFAPEPAAVTWARSHGAGADGRVRCSRGGLAPDSARRRWDSLLGTVLQRRTGPGRAARGQAQVLVVGLLACALLVLVLAATAPGTPAHGVADRCPAARRLPARHRRASSLLESAARDRLGAATGLVVVAPGLGVRRVGLVGARAPAWPRRRPRCSGVAVAERDADARAGQPLRTAGGGHRPAQLRRLAPGARRARRRRPVVRGAAAARCRRRRRRRR